MMMVQGAGEGGAPAPQRFVCESPAKDRRQQRCQAPYYGEMPRYVLRRLKGNMARTTTLTTVAMLPAPSLCKKIRRRRAGPSSEVTLEARITDLVLVYSASAPQTYERDGGPGQGIRSPAQA